MERIETVMWEPIPDKPDYVRKRGPRKVSDVFAELEASLKSANLYPDEYFILDKYFADENMMCPEFEDVICYAQWGGNEGIYLEVDIVYRNEETDTYVRKNFATGKTLSDDSRSYDRMQYIAGYIYKLFMGEKQIPARYMIVGKKEVALREQLHERILMEYESYVKNIFVHKPLNFVRRGIVCKTKYHAKFYGFLGETGWVDHGYEEDPKSEYIQKLDEFIDSLDDNTVLVAVDCHS